MRALLRRDYLRLAVLSALAAAVAYGIGAALPMVSPVVAAITALISVRPTFHASLRESLLQVLGVVVGAGVALVAFAALGWSALALGIALLAVFGVARLLRLGEEGAVAVGVTVILVAGPRLDAEAVETRLLGVLLGCAVALLASFVRRPGTPHERALAALVDQADAASALLARAAEGLAADNGVDADAAREDLAAAQRILAETLRLRAEAQEAVHASRWTPMADRDEAVAVLAQARITEAIAVTLVSMCRDLLAASQRRAALPDPVAASLSQVLADTAGAIGRQAASARARPAMRLPEETGPVPRTSASRREATVAVRGLDDTMPLLLGGALLRDSETITELLTDGHGHRDEGQPSTTAR